MALKVETGQSTTGTERVRALAPGARRLLMVVAVMCVVVAAVLVLGWFLSGGSASGEFPMLACGVVFGIAAPVLLRQRNTGVDVGPDRVTIRGGFRTRHLSRADVLGVAADGAFAPVLHTRARALPLHAFDPNSGGLPAFQRYRDQATMRLMELLDQYVAANPATGSAAHAEPFQRGGVPSDFVFPAGTQDLRQDPEAAAKVRAHLLAQASQGHPLAALEFEVIAVHGNQQIAVSHHRLLVLRWLAAPEDPYTLPVVIHCATPQELLTQLRFG